MRGLFVVKIFGDGQEGTGDSDEPSDCLVQISQKAACCGSNRNCVTIPAIDIPAIRPKNRIATAKFRFFVKVILRRYLLNRYNAQLRGSPQCFEARRA
ncbi:hypothetical protein [Bradyrhizobium sp. AZCC 2289]|uniref:hypothetical protein n=1 Tax=Bradyrhizobium sp. AZCC 2289 TaxID=3117026 RepID=UPI002FEFB0E9